MTELKEKQLVLQLPTVKLVAMRGAGGVYYVDLLAWGCDWCNDTVRERLDVSDPDPDRAIAKAEHAVGTIVRKMVRTLNYHLDHLVEDL